MHRILPRTRAASALTVAFAAAALAGARPAQAFPEYETEIPHVVTAGGAGCDGLCHNTGGTSSPLYLDFEAAGFVWNAQVANDDSDGDGFSNGWELQDPSGTWPGGASPQPGSAAFVSNPSSAPSRPPLPVATAPTAIVHSEAAGQNLSEGFAVRNVGAVPFDYTITSSDVWMAPDPPSAQALPANDEDAILLAFVTNGLIEGLYQGDLTIAIPGIRADRIPTLPVDLTVPEPDAVVAGVGALLGVSLLARRRAR